MSDTGSMTVPIKCLLFLNQPRSRVLSRKVVPAPATCSPGTYKPCPHFCCYATLLKGERCVTGQITVKITPDSVLRDMLSTTDKLMKEDFTHKLCETKQK